MAKVNVKKIVLHAIKEAVKKQQLIQGKGTAKRGLIIALQNSVAEKLKTYGCTGYNTPEPECERFIFRDGSLDPEYKGVLDRADVYAKYGDFEIIIEIDATRADQVAKKFVSRFSYHLLSRQAKTKLIYVALLYPGTGSMSTDECIKYFSFGDAIVSQLGKPSAFIGCIIKKNKEVDVYPDNSVFITSFAGLALDAYTSYLQDCGYTDNSVNCYRSALSVVNKALAKNSALDINSYIEQELKNPEIGKNKKTYLKTYLEWRKSSF